MAERKVITADDFKDAASIQNMITNKCNNNVNGNDEEGYTPLCAAILLGISQEILIDFIKNDKNKYYKGDKIDPNKKCNKGKTPLQIVCMSMNTAALDVLMGASVEVPAFITNPYNNSEQIPQYKLDPDTHEYTTEQATVEISVDVSDYKDKDIKVEARDVMSASILPKPEIFQKLINNFKDLIDTYTELFDKDLNNPLHLACLASCYGTVDALENAIVIIYSADIKKIIEQIISTIWNNLDDKIKDTIKDQDQLVDGIVNAILSDLNATISSLKSTLINKFKIPENLLSDTSLKTIIEYLSATKELLNEIMSAFVNAPNRDLKTPFMIAFENEDDGLINKLAKYVKLSIQLSSIITYYATSDKEDDKKEQIKSCLLRLVTSIIENQLNNLENYSLESFNNLFDCLNAKFTLPGGSESSLLKYIENIAKTKFEELFNNLKEKLKDVIKNKLDNDSKSFNPTLASNIIKSYYENMSNENADMQFINIDELTDKEVESLGEGIQPIIGTLKYVPKGITVLYYTKNKPRNTVPQQYYSINKCEVTWNKTAADYKALNGQRCYFSAT